MAKVKRIPDSKTFHWVNPNPLRQMAGDCVIRAICQFLGMTWEQAYRELVECGIKIGHMPNNDETYRKYLSSKGFEPKRQPRRENRKKYTAEEFCKELAQPGKTYILRLAHHLVFVGPDQRLWDTWDCGEKCVGNYWEK